MRTALGSLAAIAVALSLACTRPPARPVAKQPATPPAAIVEVSGGKQVSTIGTPLDQPLVIQVNDAQGAAVAGASVWFHSASGVVFQPASGVTGADGQFTFAVALGGMAGRYQIVVAATGAGAKTIELRMEELALGFEQNLGRQLSELYCTRCHDPESTPERVSNHDNLTAQAHAFSDGAFLNKMSDADLLSIIQHGGPALGKSAEMPPYGRTLSKSDIQALAAYIRAVADPPHQPGEAMHKGSFFLAVLTVFAVECRPQVLAPPEILDPPARALQQQHFAELKAAGVEITSHQYPFRFYLSRTLDLSERQEQLADQRSIRFSNFQGRTVLQVTGNYFAAYSDETMSRNERVKRTYLDVALPILRATVSRLPNEPKLNAFAIEISHHVRKKVLGVTLENPENLAIIIPRAIAEKVAASNNENEQVAALLDSRVFIDGNSVTLWPQQGVTASESAEPPTPGVVNASSILAATTPATPPAAPAPAPLPARDLSPAALQQQQAAYRGLMDRIVHDLDADAHFVSYAPPVLVGFHGASYLQLSITTNLAPQDSGSQYHVAALAFDRHVSHLIRPLVAMFPKDPELDGVVFSSTVRIGGVSQSVEFFLPIAELRRFEKYDTTGQQLINSGFVLINGERVGLELQSAEADIR